MIVRESPVLTAEERKVGRLMLDGLTVREIAQRLNVGEIVVMVHRGRLCQKLGTWTRSGMEEARYLLVE